MNHTPRHDHKPKAVRCYVNLISENIALSEILRGPLGADFDFRQFFPQEILDRATHEREQLMQGAVATLIDWDEQSPVVLSVLKGTARCHTVPLVVLCGPNRAEQVAALVCGGDACLTYPLNSIMLQARLLAYQRLLTLSAAGDGLPALVFPTVDLFVSEAYDVHTVGPLTLNQTTRQFFACGHLVALTPKEFDLMAFLMRCEGACHSRHDILDQVWGIDYDAETNVLDVQIYSLRRKLGPYGLEGIIQTVRGVGYRLITPRGETP